MALLGEILVRFNSDTKDLVSGIGLATAAIAGVGVAVGESVKMAGDFQTSMTRLVTSAGLAPASLAAVSAGMLKMSVDTGTSTDQLAKGMFNVESALHLGAGGLQVLQAAAQGAKAENSDLAQTTDVLTTAMVNYRLPASQAADVMNSLISTVAAGKMHMDDLTGSLKNVLPVAAAFHIKLSDVEGALSTMANAGDRGTSAGTHLAMMFKMLSSPVGAAKKEMAAMGLDSIKLAQTLQTSLPDALKMIQDAVSQHFVPGSVEYNRAILAILGGSKSGVAGLEIMNQGLKVLRQNTDAAAAALHKGSKDVENWSTIQGTFNFKMDQAKAAVGVFMVTLGTALLPTLGKVMSGVSPLIGAFDAWENKTHGVEAAANALFTALSTVGTVIGKIVSGGAGVISFFENSKIAMAALVSVLAGVTAGFIAWKAAMVISAITDFIAILPTMIGLLGLEAAAMWASAAAAIAAAAPFILIGLIVAAAVFGIIMAVTHWGAIMAWIGGVFSAIGAQLRESATKVKNDVGGIFDALGTQMRTSATKVKNDVGGAFDSMGTQMRQSATKTKNDVGNIMSGLGTIAHNAGVGIVQSGQWMYDHNTYWKAAADGIGKAFSDMGTQMRESATKVKNDVGSAFDQLGSHLQSSSTTTHNVVGTQFSDMGTQMRQSANKTGNDVGNIFSAMGTHVSQAVDTMRANSGAGFSSLGSQARGVMTALRADVIDNIGRAVGGFMSGMGSLVSGAAGKLGELAGDFFSAMGSLASQAFSWGANIIQGIINGIGSMMSSLGSMVSQAAGVVAGALGFHSPTKVGPGRDADKWMPNLIKMMSEGLIAGEPTIKSAAIQVASMLSPMINVHSSGTIGANSTSGNSNNNGTQTIIIQMDGRDVAKALGPHLTNEIRLVAQVRR